MKKRIFIIFCLVISCRFGYGQIFSASVNLPAILGASLNLEGEVAVSKKGWTVSSDVLVKPYRIKTEFSRLSLLKVTARKYQKEPFIGPFLGFGGGYVFYDINSYEGQGGHLFLSGGYSFILNKRLNLRLEAGVSVMRVTDKHTLKTEEEYRDDYNFYQKRTLLLPYPISVSLCYIF